MKFGLMTDVSAGSRAGAKGFASAQNLQTFGDYICEAEALGFNSVFLVEHHFTGNGQVSSSLSVLAYLAGRTSTIRLGTSVVVLPWHNPVLLAEQIATIDQLSGGRFDFGVGKGYRPHEFAGFRISPDEAAARYEEILAFCKQAWSTRERFDHRGEFWEFDDIVIDPAPSQTPRPPIWVGATSEASTVKAGRNGHRLLLDQIAAPDLIGTRIAQYSEAAAEAGNVVPPQSVAVNRALRLVDNDEDLRRAHADRARQLDALGAQTGTRWASFTERGNLPTGTAEEAVADEAALIGYPEDVVKRLKVLEDLGVDYVLLADFSAEPDSLRTFAEQVMPHLGDD
ncbi:LLM class flavin-dependent oxidoreductase [Prauserella halophila]|uniref:LLM class flavin-dependent oxidoreductase n=1 Tax=Prauserella halophila TaxID=185641 RepID=A0ABN1WI95_9PSEU|nr:LLM class flavin-dependent oxidoreductase [Prauserella halophila]MCP2238179.1 Flavin-dependent oxidoreductase, luciferase family (includes alkanesulfonate monooxygenase SsuD and methylene tetrahydromethanopterin reductase) [Prauserella halophila]